MSAFHKAAVEMRTTSSQDEAMSRVRSVEQPFASLHLSPCQFVEPTARRLVRESCLADITPAVCDKPTIAHRCHCHFAYLLRPHSRSAAALETWLYKIKEGSRVAVIAVHPSSPISVTHHPDS